MAESVKKSLLLLPGDNKAAEASERHKRARSIVDLIFALEPGSPRRWRAIWRLWLSVKPLQHGYEYTATVQQNKHIRASLVDKKFGRSEATLNKGRVARTGKHVQSLRAVGNMPESLYYMLKRFDPMGLGLARGKESHKMRVKLYNEFKEFKLPEKL